MSERARCPDLDRSYGELLGEYFTIVSEIAPLLDEFGRPDPEFYLEYTELRKQTFSLQVALERKTPDYEETELRAILDEAFSDR